MGSTRGQERKKSGARSLTMYCRKIGGNPIDTTEALSKQQTRNRIFLINQRQHASALFWKSNIQATIQFSSTWFIIPYQVSNVTRASVAGSHGLSRAKSSSSSIHACDVDRCHCCVVNTNPHLASSLLFFWHSHPHTSAHIRTHPHQLPQLCGGRWGSYFWIGRFF